MPENACYFRVSQVTMLLSEAVLVLSWFVNGWFQMTLA
jgi:hypothetical protein